MKNNRVKKLMTSAVILLAGLAFAMSGYAQTGDNTQDKVRLMVAAVQAKDSGDLLTAKEKLEELLKIVPSDKAVQSLLMSINDSIAQSQEQAIADERAAAVAAEQVAIQEAQAIEVEEATVFVADVKAEETMILANEQEMLDRAKLKVQKIVFSVYVLIDEAEDFLNKGRIQDASQKLDLARGKLDLANENLEIAAALPEVDEAKNALTKAYAELDKERAKAAARDGQFSEAKNFATEYSSRIGDETKADKLMQEIEAQSVNPRNNRLESVSPDYVARQKEASTLMKKGKIQYLYGDYDGARRTFRSVETLDNQNLEAKTYLTLISEKMSVIGRKSYQVTRAAMLDEVDGMWQFPSDFQGDIAATNTVVAVSPIVAKLEDIIIPEVNYNGVPLAKVITSLSNESIELDKSNDANKGVNIALMVADDSSTVTLSIRNTPLKQILDLVTRPIGYTYDIQDNIVLVTKGAADASVLNMDTEYFELSTTALDNRILGIKSSSGGDSSDPFASSSSGETETLDADARNEKLLKFFQQNGVQFGQGATASCDDSGISVTNTPTNIEKVRNILLRYIDVEQVEVEAKFLEVNQGSLDMLAFNYSLTKDGEVWFQSNNRLLSNTIAQTNAGENPTTIITPIYSDSYTDINGNEIGGSISSYQESSYAQSIPSLPSSINLASNALDTASTILGVINGFTADFVLNALSQEQGTDLLTAPRLTVVSGQTANINVSQVMFYPTTFSDVQSQVGNNSNNNNNNSNNSGSGAVSITPGTPSDFQEVNIGVTMEITPTVQADKSILIDLNPVIREFEGFMEYGGMAIAISASGTTVTVPSGFIQPVFSVRELRTQVYVFDGATIVLGGLVKEEVKTVNDGIPFLQDIPLLGTLFRSKGEARQKKNLLIFVTANRITPGGTLRNALFSGSTANSIYQNPTVRSPGGSITRVREVEETTEE